jgi:hypothetical protein
MKAAILKTLLIASLRTADPVATSRRLLGALVAKDAELRPVEDPAVQRARAALARDMQPLAEALWQAGQTDDAVAFRAGLRKLSRELARKAFVPGGGQLAATLALESAKAFTTPYPTPIDDV